MRTTTVALLGPLLALGCASGNYTTPESVLTDAAQSVEMLRQQNDALDYFIERSKAVVVFPEVRKGGFVFGTGGGTGVMLEKESGFEEPTFVSVGGVNFGLQAGVESTQVAVVIMNERLIGILKEGGLDFGVGSRLTLGPASREAASSLQTFQDAYIFRDSTGVYGGLTLDSAIVNTNSSLTSTYRGGSDAAAVGRLKSAILSPVSG